MMALPAEGGCICRQLRFRVTRQPTLAAICHCPDCQKMTGGAFSTPATIPRDGFEVITGKGVIAGLRGPRLHHHHCPDCMDWVYTTIEDDQSRVNLRATMLDDTDWFVPFVELYTATKLPWVTLSVPHSFEKFPSADRRAELVAAYAETLKEQSHG